MRAAVLFARERSDDERADKNPLQQRIDHQAKTKWLAVFLENKTLITYSPEKGSVTNQIYWSERWAIPREKWLSALWGIPACKDAKVYQLPMCCQLYSKSEYSLRLNRELRAHLGAQSPCGWYRNAAMREHNMRKCFQLHITRALSEINPMRCNVLQTFSLHCKQTQWG